MRLSLLSIGACIAIGVGVFFSSGALAQDDVSGAELAFRYKCVTCHGVDGKSGDSRYPNLGGQKKTYLKDRLNSFRAGRHKYNFMNSQAEPLTDEEIEKLAEFFNSMK